MSNEIDKVLENIASADLAELMLIWRTHDPAEWSDSPEVYQALGKAILAQGEPLLAYDVIGEGLTNWPDDARLRQLQGLALARSGATQRANTILEKLRSDGQRDEETLGMLGRTFKDLAVAETRAEDRTSLFRRAEEIYDEAWRTTGGYWTGINAATMALLGNKTDRAIEIARQVREDCRQRVKLSAGDSYWEMAALGEAALILRDLPEAKDRYSHAAAKAGKRYGDINSSRRNARLILKHWKEDPEWIDHILRIPAVTMFAGHMIDRPDRKSARFPSHLEPAMAQQIRSRLEKFQPGFGFASAACGSDILFLEAMLDRGAEISIVLPYNEEEFIQDSVAFLPNSNWRERFFRVRDRAARVIVASNQRLEIGGVSYEFCNEIITGLATIRAHRLDSELVPLAVWDGMAGDGPGGAASAVEEWRKLGYKPEIIEISKLEGARAAGPEPVERSAQNVGHESPCPSKADFSSRIVAILFADAVGFSKLTEAEVPRFVQHFLGAIAKLSGGFQETIIAKNTWGDGLYFVFSDVDAAGKFALDLADMIASTKWEEKELRPGLNLRIALHAGPVYEFDDPITGSRSYSGTHVSRAARIEPITPPGQVYASEHFAALAAAHRSRDFTCDYVGQTPMAKGYGTLPTYHVRRAAGI